MKILYKSALVLISGIFLLSCEIEREPFDSMTGEDIRTSESSAKAATVGNYSLLKGWSDNWYRLHEYPGDNSALSGTTTDHLMFTYNYQRIPNGSRTASFWTNSYRIIVGANKIMEVLEEGTSQESDQLLGENYYFRALMHFSLVNIFGRPYTHGADNAGVPIKLDGDYLNHPTRSSVGEVYAQIEEDLLKAAQLLNAYTSNVYVSQEVVWALLSRYYLYKEDNEKAIEYAEKVINSGRYSLLSTSQLADYPKFSPESNPETIFAIKFVPNVDDLSNGWGTLGSMYANLQGSGWGELYASRPFLELIRKYPEDVRNAFISPVVVDEDVTWALYVDNSNNYKMIEVTQQGDDYFYQKDDAQHTLEKEENGRGGFLYFINTENEGRKSILIDKKLDLRNGFPKYYILKISGQDGQPHLWSPVISRLAEMYLNRAEANAKLGKTEEALADVNLIRQRAGIPAEGLYDGSSLTDNQSVLDVVLEERRLELAYEGHRKLDVYRNKKNIDRRYPGTHLSGNNPIEFIEWTENKIIEFIPEGETLIHEGLEQNPL